MQAAMLGYKWLAIDADDVVVWESLSKLLLSLLVCFGIAISGHQNGSICDEEVGVSGRQTSAVFVVKRADDQSPCAGFSGVVERKGAEGS